MNTLLFSRRTTQGCIDRLRGIVTNHELKKFVDALNRPGRDRLIKLWEIVVLDALGRLGPIDHEKPLANGQRPDFAFDLDTRRGQRRVVGDITCISDTGLEDQNPVQALSDELVKTAYRMGVSPGSLDLRVEGRTQGAYRDAKMVLDLPAKREMTGFVKREIVPFLGGAKASPGTPTSIRIDTAIATLTIGYQPGKQFYSMGHPSYDVSYLLTAIPSGRASRKRRTSFAPRQPTPSAW